MVYRMWCRVYGQGFGQGEPGGCGFSSSLPSPAVSGGSPRSWVQAGDTCGGCAGLWGVDLWGVCWAAPALTLQGVRGGRGAGGGGGEGLVGIDLGRGREGRGEV